MRNPDHSQTTKEAILEALGAFFQETAVAFGLREALLYGSWAKGFGRPDSDVDVAVVFEEEDLSDDEIFRRLTDLTIRLCRLLSRDVSVIPVYPDFRKPALYYNAIVKGIPLYVRDTREHARLFSAALYHMEDFEIFGTGWQLAIAKANLKGLSHG